MSEAVDDNMYEQSDALRDGGDEEDGGDCENLLRPNKKISLNDFELVKVIGRGSFGKVYMVRR